MKRMFTMILLLSIGMSAAAQTASPAKVDEDLVLKELSHNFGRIPQGKPVTHVFEVVNNTKGTLTLDNVQASCGCTTPEWDHSPIAAGATREIRVGYNAMAEGGFEKTISIFYDKGKLKTLTIKGEVWHTPEQSAPKNTSTALLKNTN
jgi:Protein of unknown function (DUF1573)